jgi:hypothetical protein
MLNFLKNHYHTKYHGNYQHAKKLFVFDLVLLFSTILMIGANIFLFLWKPSLVGMIDLSLSLGGGRIKSGDEVRLTVNYTNTSKYKLTDTALAVRLPFGFVIDRTKTPESIFSNQGIFTSPKELAAGASGQAEIYGTFWTDIRTESHIITTLSYKPENKKNPEQKLSSIIAKLSESVLTSELTFPSSTFAGSKTPFTYTIKNTSNRTIDNINISANTDWSIQLTDQTGSNNFSLAPNTIKILEGTITVPNASNRYTLGIAPIIFIDNKIFPQYEQIQTFSTFAPQLPSKARLLNNLAYGEPGQIIPLELNWENKEASGLKNLTLHITANLTGVVDWKKTARENHATAEVNGMFFDKQSRTSLGNNKQNAGDTFTINLYLLPHFNIPQSENARLEIHPIIKATSIESPNQTFSQDGSHASLPLATEVDFSNIEARYYTAEGDQLGRGPLPPQVNKTTKYWIFIKLANTSNAIEDIQFKTRLPENIEFTGKQSTTIGPSLNYNPADRSVTWKYFSLPAHSQTGLYFEVAATPQQSQVGKNIQLTNILELSTIDSFVKKEFRATHQPIYNSLNKNDSGSGFSSAVNK